MLLKALYDFANSRKLLDDLAFAPKAIRWLIQLDADGNLLGVMDTSEDGRRGRTFEGVPKLGGSKNSGGVAEFLADRLTAVFGVEQEPEKLEGDEKKRQSRLDNNTAKYESFWQQIERAFEATQNQALSALLKFHHTVGTAPPFLRWDVKDPGDAKERPAWWITTAKGDEFKYRADNFSFLITGYLVVEDQDLRDWWQNLQDQKEENVQQDEATVKGICLVTGVADIPIARTHFPKIEIGFRDTPPGGAAIVSFEKSSPAFSSYGFVQSYNAPVSMSATTAYCAALRHLLKSKTHRLRIGKTIACFWARDSEEATDIFAWAFDKPKPENVHDFLNAPRTGVQRSLSAPDDFYSVTLSGNGGRVVVRHWMQMPVENAVANLRQWFADLDLVTFSNPSGAGKARRKARKADDAAADNDQSAKSGSNKESTPPLALYRLACATVRDAKNLQADVPAQLYRVALEGTTPPLSLLKPILNRLKADLCKFGVGILETPISGKVLKAMTDSKTPIPPPGQSRMALIKMILNRNSQTRKEGEQMIEPQVFETDDPAYNCGRLLAVLAEAQRKAHDHKLEGAGVAERYFGTACSSPSSVFPLLIRLNRHHLSKVGKSDRFKGQKRFLEESIQNILSLFKPKESKQPPVFPRSLDLQAQGRFALGFYQQQAADAAARRPNERNDNQPQSTS